MRIKESDFEAKGIVFVLVNNKRVVHPVEVDTEEGWCLAAIPDFSNQQIVEITNVNPDTDKPEEVSEIKIIHKKLVGKIDLIYKEDKNVE